MIILEQKPDLYVFKSYIKLYESIMSAKKFIRSKSMSKTEYEFITFQFLDLIFIFIPLGGQ